MPGRTKTNLKNYSISKHVKHVNALHWTEEVVERYFTQRTPPPKVKQGSLNITGAV